MASKSATTANKQPVKQAKPVPKKIATPKPRAKPVPAAASEGDALASMPARLEALLQGQSESVSRFVPRDQATQSHLIEVGNKLASSMRSAVSRAKVRRSGFTYQVNIGRFTTRDDDYCVCVVVTRTA